MAQHFKRIRQRLMLVTGALLIAVAALAALPAPKAGATGCHFYNYTANAGGFAEGSDFVFYTGQQVVPSTSSCHDINLNSMYDTDSGLYICTQVRVRFYPSSGGNYANSWKLMCQSYAPFVVASNVGNGTHYRLEFKNYIMAGQAFD